MKLKSPHFDKLKSLTKKQKKLILAGIALLLRAALWNTTQNP